MKIFALAGHALVALAVAVLAAPLWFLPWRAALALGRWYGYLGLIAYPAGRRTALINLRRFHGQALTRAQALRLTGRVFGSLGQAIAEGLQFSRRFAGAQPGWDDHFDIEDPDVHARVLRETRPKLLVTAHLGSWEMALMAAGMRLGDGSAVMRRVDNPFIERMLRWARRSPSELIDKRGGVAAAEAHLAGGGSLALLLDENGGYKGVFVDFLGRPASTYRSAALLSARSGCPIVVAAAVRRPRGRYLYRMAWIEPASGPESLTGVTQQITTILENWIREDEDQWRWIHWRWKTRPDGTEETYTRSALRDVFAAAPAGAHRKETCADEV